MLKHKMKQWLSAHQPEALRIGAKEERGSPTSTTPPLCESLCVTATATVTATAGVIVMSTQKVSAAEAERGRYASTSAVNQYPSLKFKILGPKMGGPSPSSNACKENSHEEAAGVLGASWLAKSTSSTSNLAAAAALATGLHYKRKRDASPVKPSPIRIVRVKEDYDYDYGKRAGAAAAARNPTGSLNQSNADALRPPNPASKSILSHAVKKEVAVAAAAAAAAVAAAAAAEEEQEDEEDDPVEETDDDIARRLHQELNCAPMRQSRSRRNISCAQESVIDDPVHGQDPGILPSC
jgi:hypothetical protein